MSPEFMEPPQKRWYLPAADAGSRGPAGIVAGFPHLPLPRRRLQRPGAGSEEGHQRQDLKMLINASLPNPALHPACPLWLILTFPKICSHFLKSATFGDDPLARWTLPAPELLLSLTVEASIHADILLKCSFIILCFHVIHVFTCTSAPVTELPPCLKNELRFVFSLPGLTLENSPFPDYSSALNISHETFMMKAVWS